MRHKKSRIELNRFTSWRKATLKSMARSVLIYQSIKTTKTKAVSVKPLVEKLISLGKVNTLSAKRQAFDLIGDHQLVSLLFSDIAPRFVKRQGGYTRMFNLGPRRGDDAKMVILELTEIKEKEVKKPKKEKEAHSESAKKAETAPEEVKPKTSTAVKEAKPPIHEKPQKKFLGGIKNIFKKERDSL